MCIRDRIEKAQDTADQKKAEETAKRLMQNKFDMNDMLDQFEQVKKMGGAAAMMSMFPGAGRISDDELDKSEKELGRKMCIRDRQHVCDSAAVFREAQPADGSVVIEN